MDGFKNLDAINFTELSNKALKSEGNHELTTDQHRLLNAQLKLENVEKIINPKFICAK